MLGRRLRTQFGLGDVGQRNVAVGELAYRGDFIRVDMDLLS